VNKCHTTMLCGGLIVLSIAAYMVYGRGRSTEAPPVVVGAIPTPTALAGYRLPLDQYRLSSAETLTVDRAHAQLVAACMHGLGFKAYQPAAVTIPAPVEGPGDYGFLDPTRAATFGFHDPHMLDRAAAPSTSESPAEIAALSGVDAHGSGPAAPSDPAASASPGTAIPGTAIPGTAIPGTANPGTATFGNAIPAGGCVAAAQRQLAAGDLRTKGPVIAELMKVSVDQTNADQRVITGTRAWAACMARAGYTYRAPVDLETEQWAATPTPTEIAIAVADVTCTQQTNLPGIAMAVLAAVQKRLIRQYRADLVSERAGLDAMVTRANQVLAGGTA
jgi:hypothetical protein